MGLYQGGFLDLTDAVAATVAIVDANGDQITNFSTVATPPANATLTQVSSSVSSTVIVAANANRKKAIIYNNSTKTLKIAFAATTSTGIFTTIIGPNGSYETEENSYTGIISGFWSGVNGNAQVTEITP